MKQLFTLLLLFFTAGAFAQTTEYETGYGTGDDWTGWSTPVTTNCTGSYTGVNGYQFAGSNGDSYSFEIYRQFNIYSNDIDIYLDVLGQDCTIEILHSTDNVTYTSLHTENKGAGYSVSNIIEPTVDPGGGSFYLKIKVNGTFGSPSNTTLYYMKIDAVLNSGNSVNISPTGTQIIQPGANGTTLTANEVPGAADSREWKYSTTSGSGYMSFMPAETATTYTPNFASAGTYYVICESTFGGNVETSNEIQITVADDASTSDIKLGENVIFANQQLNIYLLATGYNVQIFDLSGRMIADETNMTSYDFTAEDPGVYFVAIAKDNESRKTLKIVNR